MMYRFNVHHKKHRIFSVSLCENKAKIQSEFGMHKKDTSYEMNLKQRSKPSSYTPLKNSKRRFSVVSYIMSGILKWDI